MSAIGRKLGFFAAAAVVSGLFSGASARAQESGAAGPAATGDAAAPVSEPAPPAVDHKEVLDFCYMPGPKSSTHSHKQRLVLFGMAGREVMYGPEQQTNEKGEVIKGVEHHVMQEVAFDGHARSVFRSTFLMDRFSTIEASVESPKGFAKKSFVSDQELISATEVDPFAAYSLACTDWAILPRVTEKQAEWRQVKQRRTVQGRTVEKLEWVLNVTWKAEADVYRRVANGFQLAATVEGSNGGAAGLAFGLAAEAPHRDPGGKAPTTLLSKRPKPGCQPPLLPELSSLAEGLTNCPNALGGLAEGAKKALEDETKSAEKPDSVSPPTEETPPADKGTKLTRAKDAKPQDLKAPTKDGKPTNTKDAKATADAAAAEAPKEEEKPVLSDEERAVLKALADSDPNAVARLAAAAVGAKHPAIVNLAASAKGTFEACKQPITAVTKISEKLRDISQKGPAALGMPVLLGLASCVGIDLDVDLSTASPPGTDELDGKFCSQVDADVSRGPAAMRDVATCSGRVAIERTTLLVQKHVKEVDGIRLHGVLVPSKSIGGNLFGLALGRAEGVQRGDAYVAVRQSPGGEKQWLGFGRIQQVGPGGDTGDAEPSDFKFRSGEADLGTRMEEHPQVGVPLSFEPLVSYYLINGGLDTTLAFGGAVEGGYNASKFVPVADEVWGRACLSFALGSKREMFATMELGPDVVHYLGAGLAARAGTGVAIQFASKSVEVMPGTSESLTGSNLAAYLNGALEYAFSPDWGMRLTAGYRQGLGAAKLENKAKTRSIDAGMLSTLHAGLLAGYTF
jgi:hypothetical protein